MGKWKPKKRPQRPGDGRKPRIPILSIGSVAEPVTISSIHGPGADGLWKFLDERGDPVAATHATIGVGYPRRKGVKTIISQPVHPSRMENDPNRGLARYPHLFAVDTNTRAIGGCRVSLAAVVRLSGLHLAGSRWKGSVVRIPRVLEVHEAVAPERIGWVFAMEEIARLGVTPPYGLVVDSDLGALPALNERREPVIPGVPLPAQVTLIYASGDVGKHDYAANAALDLADRYSGDMLDLLGAGEDPGGSFRLAPIVGGLCTRHREITVQHLAGR